MHETWTDILLTSYREVALRLSQVVPRFLVLLSLVLVGWAVAAAARRLIVRLLQAANFDGRCERWGLTASLVRARYTQPPTLLVSRGGFWLIFLVALLMGVEALEMPATAGLVAAVLRSLSNLIVAGLVLVIGWLLANFLGQAGLIGTVNAQVASAPLIAGAIRWLVLVFAGAAVLTQLGIAREMVLLAFGVAFGGTMLMLALAFGLGGKDLAREILESRLRKQGEDRNSLPHV